MVRDDCVVVEPPGFFFGRFPPDFSSIVLGTAIMSQGSCTANTPAPEQVKLSQLRAKTDHQLRDLIDSTLHVGLSFAALAEVEESAGDGAYARSFERAYRALADVQKLLPVLNEEYRQGLDPKFIELREALDRLGRNRGKPRSFSGICSY